MSTPAAISELLHREHLHTLAVAGDLEARAENRRAGPIDVAQPRDRARLEALVAVIDEDVLRHYRFEEEVLFPRLVEAGLGPMVDVLVMEHDAVRAIALPLRAAADAALAGAFTAESWQPFRDGLFDLVNSVSFHIQKEELGVIRQLRTVLGADAERELGTLYAGFG
jgi:iron-sulfur cluster repair protein YtfE (RIC family)